MNRLASTVLVASIAFTGCASDRAPSEDGRDDSFTTDGKLDGVQASAAEAVAILDVVNTMSKAKLVSEVNLSAKAADAIVAVRIGDDEAAGTSDDHEFSSLADLDMVPYVGPNAFQALLDYVHDADLVGDSPGSQWAFEMFASGDKGDFAVAPDGSPVAVYTPPMSTTYKVTLPNGTVVNAPADATVQWGSTPQVAVDSAGIVHLYYPVTSGATAFHRHATHEGGHWVQHSDITEDAMLVDQGPEGQIYALAGTKATSIGENQSYLRVYALQPGNSMDSSSLGWYEMNKFTTGFSVGTDGLPAVVVKSPHYLNAMRPGSNGWASQQLTPRVSYAITTTGNQSATVFANIEGNVNIYRETSGSYFLDTDEIATPAVTSMDATYDAGHVAHACFVADGILTHVTVDPTGAQSSTPLGNADQCWLGMDATGRLHMFTRTGAVIRHATLD